MGLPKGSKNGKPEPVIEEPQDETQEEADEEPESAEKGMSKAEAVRRALAAGMDGPEEGTVYILREFGIEISKPHFSCDEGANQEADGRRS